MDSSIKNPKGNFLKKLKKKKAKIIRFIIQIVFFVTMPSAFTSAFSGVKYIFNSLGAGQKLEITSFLLALIALCAYTVVFGRFFCGYACAFGSFGDYLYEIGQFVSKKIKIKLPQIPLKIRKALDYLKYVILIAICALCFLKLYDNLRGYSPWDVFSMITAGNFKLKAYILGIILLVLIIIGMILQERFFCRFICPMGAVFSLLPAMPVTALLRDRQNCRKGCKACLKKCPIDLEISDIKEKNVNAGCIQCQKCVNICPKSNIKSLIPFIKGNELWWLISRAAVLMALLMAAGI
ncbi:4Fe-4S binding domain-containing protein [Acetitomaculum ruminis DSM 5522]|uniref:4Fe-4S binding domain-containing protein n=1 Tax=Acetitomaculum ruminis DSM 5522 TaxID=1120918 RepID=A0A1I0YHB3_9FIRM|nr:4Fe-4S binding protein [Acetitomaculum ruminis]SFB12759.1 4Fe-4S binding domain-containing protein [Acetitomaculum ruminis DSM 5522]